MAYEYLLMATVNKAYPDLESGDREETEIQRLGGDRLRLVEHGVDTHGEEHERHHHGKALHTGVIGALRPHKYGDPKME